MGGWEHDSEMSSLTPSDLLAENEQLKAQMKDLQFYKLFYNTLPAFMHSDLKAMCGDVMGMTATGGRRFWWFLRPAEWNALMRSLHGSGGLGAGKCGGGVGFGWCVG